MGTCSVIESALGEWRAARKLLATAIQSYRDVCISLSSTASLPLSQPSERAMLEDLFLTISSEFDSLEEDENSLYSARMLLAAMRNKSVTLAPVNTLPTEVLARIFGLSKTDCVHDARTGFQNFTSVCTYWRQTAIHAVDLWTHVDVVPGRLDLTNLLLGRTKNASINLHLFEPTPQVSSEPTSEQEVQSIVSALRHHMHRVRNLEMASYSQSDGLIRAVLNSWLIGGSPNLANNLVVLRPNTLTLLSYGGQNENANIINHSENAKEMIRSLSSLCLQNTRFDWSSDIYCGLVHLRLSSPCTKIAISVLQLAHLLVSSPALRTLKLSSLRVDRGDIWSPPPPIPLRHLESLSLFLLDHNSLMLALPLIELPTSLPQLDLGFTTPNPMYGIVDDFITRSNPTALYCGCDHHCLTKYPTWLSILGSLPRLRSLVLKDFWFQGREFIEINAVIPQRLLLSNPPTIVLQCCTVTIDALESLVGEYGIRDLRLERCKSVGITQRMEDVGMLLMRTYPELKCVVSNTESTMSLVHCSSDV